MSNPLIDALVQALTGANPVDAYLASVDNEGVVEPDHVADFEKFKLKLNNLEPTLLRGAFLTVLVDDGSPKEQCPGCGGFHSNGNTVMGFTWGTEATAKALVMRLMGVIEREVSNQEVAQQPAAPGTH